MRKELLSDAYNAGWSACMKEMERIQNDPIVKARKFLDPIYTTADELAELLREAQLQIEYLHGKFQATGSGNSVLSRITTALAKYDEEKKQ